MTVVINAPHAPLRLSHISVLGGVYTATAVVLPIPMHLFEISAASRNHGERYQFLHSSHHSL